MSTLGCVRALSVPTGQRFIALGWVTTGDFQRKLPYHTYQYIMCSQQTLHPSINKQLIAIVAGFKSNNKKKLLFSQISK